MTTTARSCGKWVHCETRARHCLFRMKHWRHCAREGSRNDSRSLPFLEDEELKTECDGGDKETSTENIE